MSTYTYACLWCNQTRTITRLNNKEICCGSQMKLVKTYPPNIYAIKMAVPTHKNEPVKNRYLIKGL